MSESALSGAGSISTVSDSLTSSAAWEPLSATGQ